MNTRTLSSLFALFSVFAVACASTEPEDDNSLSSTGGDEEPEYGESTNDELTTESQFNGRSLPARTIVLTYDDGPGPRTAELAEYLKEEGISATFFINGMQVPGRESALRAIIENGHTLANHTQNHKQLTTLTPERVRSEVQSTDDIIAEYQEAGPWLIRAPFGAWNARTSSSVNQSTTLQKYVGSVFWDIGGQTTSTAAADWECWGAKRYSVEKCASLYSLETRTRGRGILLMHDLHNKTVEMSKILIPQLKQAGFSFAKLQDVPTIAQAIGSPSQPVEDDGSCRSATLGRVVAENVCVQAASNAKWNICKDGEWVLIPEPTAECTETHPLEQ